MGRGRTLNLASWSLGPTPLSMRRWGVWTAPADRITSRSARTAIVSPRHTYSTPAAFFPSKITSSAHSIASHLMGLHSLGSVKMKRVLIPEANGSDIWRKPLGHHYHSNVFRTRVTCASVRMWKLRRCLAVLRYIHPLCRCPS